METKKDIRSRMLRKRNALDLAKRRRLSVFIQEKAIESRQFQESDWILLYMNAQSEVCTDLLFDQCLQMNKKIACPKVVSAQEMEFVQVDDTKQFEAGYRGILEPKFAKRCEPTEALVIAPGCAFDRFGFRLGYGKGFYDRYLKAHPHYQTMGLAFSCQLVERLPHEPHDVFLQSIVTETELITV